MRLNFMFTLAAVATNITALVTGTILDQYGPRVCSIIGAVLFALGSAGFGLASRIKGIDREYILFFVVLRCSRPLEY